MTGILVGWFRILDLLLRTMMEPYISGSEEEVRRREVYMYYGLLAKVAELKLFTSGLKLVLWVF